jgi:ferrochelatase
MLGPYQALLFVSFGGPEGPDDVMPFLENVLRGKPVPRERMLEVAEHYYHFGGVSPINEQNRQLIAALKAELEAHAIDLPVYWGNRNWHPLLADTIQQMKADGITRALSFMTSAFSSYSGCRQYRENIQGCQAEIGDGAPTFDKLRVFYNHPGFVEPVTQNVQSALEEIPQERRGKTAIVFTAHSIPMGMATGSLYESQLNEACRLVGELIGRDDWSLVYQSRSGPPQQPWLEPDILDHIRDLHSKGVKDIVITPIGFVSDHMEVLFDLDTEARDLCEQLGVTMVRAKTVGTAPRFVSMIRELIEERALGREKLALGPHGPCHDVCPENCCPSGRPAHGGRPRPPKTA